MTDTGEDGSKNGDRAQILGCLGLSRDEIRAYLELLGGSATPATLARRMSTSVDTQRKTLMRLGARGLVRKYQGRTQRFEATPPSWVLPALIQKRDQETSALRMISEQLDDRYRQGYEQRPQISRYLELVAGGEAIRAAAQRLVRKARTRARLIIAPPFGSDEATLLQAAVRQHVDLLMLWDSAIVEAKYGRATARDLGSAPGVSSKFASDLPCGLIVSDESSALLCLGKVDHDPAARIALVTRDRSLVAVASSMFDLLWQIAVAPVRVDGRVDLERETLADVIDCLVAGLTDSAIARTLGISRRTLSRRIDQLLKSLGVKTRFQAALRLALSAQEGRWNRAT